MASINIEMMQTVTLSFMPKEWEGCYQMVFKFLSSEHITFKFFKDEHNRPSIRFVTTSTTAMKVEEMLREKGYLR